MKKSIMSAMEWAGSVSISVLGFTLGPRLDDRLTAMTRSVDRELALVKRARHGSGAALLSWCVMAGLAALLLLGGTGPTMASAQEGTGLPLPRYVSLRAGKVNLRAGPSVRYPVQWVYRRPGLPVEIIAEFDTWRKIRDWQGSQGWVHQSMLSGKRTFIALRDELVREKPDLAAPPVARLENQVVGRVMSCAKGANWCRIEVEGYKGWLPRDILWGVYARERL